MIFVSHSPKDTQELAGKAATFKIPQCRGRIFALAGDLGSGKTAFAQAFIKALGIEGRITSPTFLIVKSYPVPKLLRWHGASKFKKVYHIDCYRIHKPADLIKLGFREIISNPENIVLIEWADRIKKIIPKDAVWLYFEHGQKENERIIIKK